MTIDLKSFCWPSDTDSYRADLAEPFSSDAYTYATDGRIMVRVERVAGTEVEPKPDFDLGSKVKTLEGYLSRIDGAKFEPMPSVDIPPKPPYVPNPCTDCGATGKVHSIECYKCQGRGITICPTCDHEDDCERCNGAGCIDRPAKLDDNPEHIEVCDNCKGTGDLGDPNTDPIVFTRVGPYWIDRKYVVLMQTLPGLEIDMSNVGWHVSTSGASIGHSAPVLFRFDGGVGGIMPLLGKPDEKPTYDQSPTDPHHGGKVSA